MESLPRYIGYDFSTGSFGTGRPAATGRIQQPVLPFLQGIVKEKQGGRLDDDRCSGNPVRIYKHREEAQEDSVCGGQIWRSLA